MLIFCACALCTLGLSQLFTLVLFIHYAVVGRLPSKLVYVLLVAPRRGRRALTLLCVYDAVSCFAFPIR